MPGLNVSKAVLVFTVETQGSEHADTVVDAIRGEGYAVKSVDNPSETVDNVQ